jgi:hypothetical protein
MAMKQDYTGMSDLEREIELEMDDELELDDEASDEEVDDDREAGDETEFELLEGDHETTLDEQAEMNQEGAFESGEDFESEIEADARIRDQEYVERLMEIAGRQYESESEVEQALNETLDGMAQERLFGGIAKRLRKFGSKLAQNKTLMGLARKGLSVASGQFPAIKAALSLAKGDLKSTLANLGKQAISAAIPGGGAALGALNALGFTQSESPEDNREAWENYVQLSREAFDHLGNNITPNADQPLEASRLAANAYQHALKRAQQRTAVNGGSGQAARGQGGRGALNRRRVARITVKPGQIIVLRNARKVVIRG